MKIGEVRELIIPGSCVHYQGAHGLHGVPVVPASVPVTMVRVRCACGARAVRLP